MTSTGWELKLVQRSKNWSFFPQNVLYVFYGIMNNFFSSRMCKSCCDFESDFQA